MLARLTVDRLHEPYRAAAYPEFPKMVAAAREAGALGACLSGAGSTILAFADSMTGDLAGRSRVRRRRRR
jgi:homoserine kinase